jgi:hypothetical protein
VLERREQNTQRFVRGHTTTTAANNDPFHSEYAQSSKTRWRVMKYAGAQHSTPSTEKTLYITSMYAYLCALHQPV